MRILFMLFMLFSVNSINSQSFLLTPHVNPINGDNWNELTTEITIENITSVTKNVKIRKKYMVSIVINIVQTIY